MARLDLALDMTRRPLTRSEWLWFLTGWVLAIVAGVAALTGWGAWV